MLQESLRTTSMLIALVILFWIMGFPFARLLMPERLAHRCVLTAGPMGFAVTALFTGVLSVIGTPVRWSGIVLLCAVGVWYGERAIALRLKQIVIDFRVWPSARRDLFHLGVLVLIVGAVGSWIMYVGPTRFADPWGSGDFFYYWVGGDYLLDHGATATTLSTQQEFNVNALHGHLLVTFRPSSNTPLAFLGIFSGEWGVLPFVNPLLLLFVVFCALSLLLAGQLMEVRGSFLASMGSILCAMSYFGLRYTYVAHYGAFCLWLFGFVVLEATEGQKRRLGPWIGVSLVLMGSVLSFDSQVLLVGFALGVYALLVAIPALCASGWRAGAAAGIRAAGVPLLAVCIGVSLFLPRMLVATRYFMNRRPLPGWEWPRLPSVADLVGWEVPWSQSPAFPWNAWLPITLGVVGLVIFGVARVRSRSVTSVISAQLVMCGTAFSYYAADIGNASHAIWKTVAAFSFFVPFFLVIGIVTIAGRLERARWRRAVTAAFVSGFFSTQVYVIGTAPPCAPWYGRKAVELARRNHERFVVHLSIPVVDGWILDPVTRNPATSGIMQTSTASTLACPANSAFLWDARDGDGSVVFDKKGRYRLGLPPHVINAPELKTSPWVLDAREGLPELGANTTLLLGGSGETLELEVTTRGSGEQPPQVLRVQANGVEAATLELAGANPIHRVHIPQEARKRCETHTLVQLLLTQNNANAAPIELQRIRIVSDQLEQMAN